MSAGDGEDLAALLRRCETEPIHTPGAVQGHGALLVTDADEVVTVASADLSLLATDPRSALGRRLDDVLGPGVAEVRGRFPVGEPFSAPGPDGTTVDVVAIRTDDGLLVEVEPPSDVDIRERSGIATMIRRLQSSTTVEDLLDAVVTQVRALTGFDRVMVYRFDEEWNGTVVAEAAAAGIGSFLDLRYPASDIPPQARALYLRNRVRLIPDVEEPSVPLVTGVVGAGPVDLSDAALRAVSPVHIDYLRNMGVRASGSGALVVDGRLWGLVACHHYEGPRRPSQRLRYLIDVLCGTASALLGGLVTTAVAVEQVELSDRLDRASAALLDGGTDAVSALDPALGLDLVDADGFVVVADGVAVASAGVVPGERSLAALLARLDADGGAVTVTAAVDTDLPGLVDRDDGDGTAGLAAVRWREGGSDWLVASRRELVRSVRWGGDPAHKEVVLEPEGARLGPRSSFEEYVETVRGTSAPWTAAQVAALAELARRVGAAAAERERRDRSVALLMQRAVLLDGVPPVPGLDVGATYRPARGDGLGGDWFDVYFGRDGHVTLALGDVAGHGMEVAATMSQLRHALRAYTLTEATVGQAMQRLNELCFELLPRDMATVVVADVDTATGRVELVNAGHLPPVFARADGGATLLESPRNPALGVSSSASFEPASIQLVPGDRLVLCTDGLIERKHGPQLDEQLARFAAAIDDAGPVTSQQLCEDLTRRFEPDGVDDLTVLGVRLQAGTDDERPGAAPPDRG
ncbi:SpoIIE family protein phosphatase [Dermatobacter hominis]|uniref:SpoIIE family protein phosphatase n=1 Tax=Dermatobacter hominis TaxID=2884263 RepID=UPI001D123A86|nr:SpoIIE family protein phosphatase [Dermatobacter hominis]UDY37531.1 SpoIIE family protein phosphatase [Dermatobacter hominis]